jgi:hypothetical protein
MQPRWELKNIELEAFIWNHDRGRFDFNGSKDIFDEALYELIEETSKRLREELVKSSICNFEIRAVSVVRT